MSGGWIDPQSAQRAWDMASSGPERRRFARQLSQGRHIVQAALKQGRAYKVKRRVWLPDPILADIDREYLEAAVEAHRLRRREST